VKGRLLEFRSFEARIFRKGPVIFSSRVVDGRVKDGRCVHAGEELGGTAHDIK